MGGKVRMCTEKKSKRLGGQRIRYEKERRGDGLAVAGVT
jgi:hypothetical protein